MKNQSNRIQLYIFFLSTFTNFDLLDIQVVGISYAGVFVVQSWLACSWSPSVQI